MGLRSQRLRSAGPAPSKAAVEALGPTLRRWATGAEARRRIFQFIRVQPAAAYPWAQSRAV